MNTNKPCMGPQRCMGSRRESCVTCIGQSLHLDVKTTAITDFIADGNDVFIATKDLPDLVDAIAPATRISTGHTLTRPVNFYHPLLEEKHQL